MTTAIQIESGVPIPGPRRRTGGRKPKYPLAEMRVGQSFWSPVTVSALHGCIRRAGLDGRTFTVRNETRDGTRGARCWRTS